MLALWELCVVTAHIVKISRNNRFVSKDDAVIFVIQKNDYSNRIVVFFGAVEQT